MFQWRKNDVDSYGVHAANTRSGFSSKSETNTLILPAPYSDELPFLCLGQFQYNKS